MSPLLKIGRSLRSRITRSTGNAKIKLGFVEPRMEYPFTEVMLKHPVGRPSYRWGTLCAAFLGKALGYERISVIEFGVAGGNGLVKLEAIAKDVERASGVGIDVYGFDTGEGLTKPRDYRDLPQLWREGDYKMDVGLLESRLTKARLVLGPVAETIDRFLSSEPAPVGFISFDLDLYSSTMDAFRLLDARENFLLPRITCYFDDIIGFSHGDFNGERLAISDFNETHESRKISKLYGLGKVLKTDMIWADMMYMFHDFEHTKYCEYDGTNFVETIPL